jgi:hypothetical protein
MKRQADYDPLYLIRLHQIPQRCTIFLKAAAIKSDQGLSNDPEFVADSHTYSLLTQIEPQDPHRSLRQ